MFHAPDGDGWKLKLKPDRRRLSGPFGIVVNILPIIASVMVGDLKNY